MTKIGQDTKTVFQSKINWAQIIGAGAMLGSVFGLQLDPATQAAVVTTIGLLTQVVTFLLRTFFTTKPIAASN